jgi:hypothetical protein
MTLSHAYSQRDFNIKNFKGQGEIDYKDDQDRRIFANEEPNSFIRSNSSKKLITYDFNNTDRLKGTFYNRNNLLSPKSLSTARLNRSIKKNNSNGDKINKKEYPSYSNLHEIQENLEKMKSPKPKARTNQTLKTKK